MREHSLGSTSRSAGPAPGQPALGMAGHPSGRRSRAAGRSRPAAGARGGNQPDAREPASFRCRAGR